MTDLLRRIELSKLAHELGVDLADVAFLDALGHEELAELRGIVTEALFAPHAHRFGRMASFAKLIPPSLAAKGAQYSLGPVVAARAAAVTDPDLAVRMAGHLSPSFLTKMAAHLDPAKVAGIVSRLPEDLVVEVGQRLVARREYIPLGRFVSAVPVRTALRVVDHAPPLELLQVALYTEDRAALDAVVEHIEADRLAAVLTAADEADDVDDALILLSALSVPARTRVVRIAAGLDEHVRDSLLRTIARNDAWDDLVPTLEHLPMAELDALIAVPAVEDPEVRASLLRAADQSAHARKWYDEVEARLGR